MAGHSKWNNIKNRKGAVDAKRARIFTQLAKQIRVAVKEGKSGDPKANASLRVVLEKARLNNMPKDKIQRAIDKGLGKSISGAQVHEIMYEGFGPGGVAFVISAITDNPHRTSSELRYTFSRAGGSLAGPGSASYLFRHDLEKDVYSPTMPMIVDEEIQTKTIELIADLGDNEDVEGVYCSIIVGDDETSG